VGGGVRSAELTLPGFVHDICSAVHPLAAVSPLFRTLPLATYGLEWVEPPAMLAHPFDDGSSRTVYRSIERTAAGMGRDERAYSMLMTATAGAWPRIEDAVLGPLCFPRHPLTLARFGLQALRSAENVGRSLFADDGTRALFAGIWRTPPAGTFHAVARSNCPTRSRRIYKRLAVKSSRTRR
jgi:phytoene dehydrogenase-like protein